LVGYRSVFELASDMRADQQLCALPTSIDESLTPDQGARWQRIGEAYQHNAGLSRGPHIPLAEACEVLRLWIDQNIG
jgi:hypothetical protein